MLFTTYCCSSGKCLHCGKIHSAAAGNLFQATILEFVDVLRVLGAGNKSVLNAASPFGLAEVLNQVQQINICVMNTNSWRIALWKRLYHFQTKNLLVRSVLLPNFNSHPPPKLPFTRGSVLSIAPSNYAFWYPKCFKTLKPLSKWWRIKLVGSNLKAGLRADVTLQLTCS